MHVQVGRYREIASPSRLVFTWTCEALGVHDSVVTIELRALADDKTELSLTHELLDDGVRDRHEAGWTACLANLNNVIERNPTWP